MCISGHICNIHAYISHQRSRKWHPCLHHLMRTQREFGRISYCAYKYYYHLSLCRVYITSDNLRTQPKFIFLSQLLLLFKFCHFCKADNPLVETRQVGTMAVVTSTCTNKKCSKKDIIWNSQPNMPGSKIAAGIFLLCMAILLSGSSASKVLQLFKHMGVACFSLNTFFRHQRVRLSTYFITRHKIHVT